MLNRPVKNFHEHYGILAHVSSPYSQELYNKPAESNQHPHFIFILEENIINLMKDIPSCS